MGIKSFLMKKTLQMKGVPKEQAEKIAAAMAENPQLADSLKSLEQNPAIKNLFEKVQKEIKEKTDAGMPEAYAAVQVMGKYKSDIAKHREELAPLMQLLGK